ncbi:MAG: sigma-70 family RNA polymerase sigma factor [Planctomycetales bacterium]|nr:sigma-70 family RNA polymerase sigma factor [Planctomycetales bacterium]
MSRAADPATSHQQLLADELLPSLYRELKHMASQQLLSENVNLTLNATALVHEAYLRLSKDGRLGEWNSRGHFFSAAAEAMRRVLVDHARKRHSQKRGGRFQRVELTDGGVENIDDERLLALDDALQQLAFVKPRVVELIKLRYFAGMSNDEAAECLSISPRTAKHWWAFAKAWLRAELDS